MNTGRRASLDASAHSEAALAAEGISLLDAQGLNEVREIKGLWPIGSRAINEFKAEADAAGLEPTAALRLGIDRAILDGTGHPTVGAAVEHGSRFSPDLLHSARRLGARNSVNVEEPR